MRERDAQRGVDRAEDVGHGDAARVVRAHAHGGEEAACDAERADGRRGGVFGEEVRGSGRLPLPMPLVININIVCGGGGGWDGLGGGGGRVAQVPEERA